MLNAYNPKHPLFLRYSVDEYCTHLKNNIWGNFPRKELSFCHKL